MCRVEWEINIINGTQSKLIFKFLSRRHRTSEYTHKRCTFGKHESHLRNIWTKERGKEEWETSSLELPEHVSASHLLCPQYVEYRVTLEGKKILNFGEREDKTVLWDFAHTDTHRTIPYQHTATERAILKETRRRLCWEHFRLLNSIVCALLISNF